MKKPTKLEQFMYNTLQFLFEDADDRGETKNPKGKYYQDWLDVKRAMTLFNKKYPK